MSRKTTSRRSRKPAAKATAKPAAKARPLRRTRRAPAPGVSVPVPPEREPESDASRPLAVVEVEPRVDPEAASDSSPLPAEVAASAPEVDYAARTPLPEPERAWPDARRAVFFDVENTSHVPYVERMLRHLGLDRGRSRTDFVAVGNWRVISLDIARLLARHGAQLVHSAPATGVRDWSDLRIAVSAGVWLGAARPGDRIEVVSDDRAFDAVGDVAAALGIEFHRLSHRVVSGAPPAAAPAAAAAPSSSSASSSRYRGRRRRPYGRSGPGPSHVAPVPPVVIAPPAPAALAPPPAEEAAPASVPAGEPHTAPHDEIIHVVRELVGHAHGRPILIDTLARELKRRGFGRTPGSPRLVTRLRRIRDLSVSPSGMIALVGGAAAALPPPPPAEPAMPAPEPEPELVAAVAAEDPIDELDDSIGNRRVEASPASAPAAGAGRPHHSPRRRRRGGRRPTARPAAS